MSSAYVISGYIFIKVQEDAKGNCYFDITHPDGRILDYRHLFTCTDEMVKWVKNRDK